MVLAAATILTFTVGSQSQICYEASGQTMAFTLKAGAKSGPTAIREFSGMRGRINNGLNVATTRGGILVTLPTFEHGIADIAVYDVAGRQIYRQHGFSGTSLYLEPRTLAAGIYTVRVQGDAKNYLRRFVVSW